MASLPAVQYHLDGIFSSVYLRVTFVHLCGNNTEMHGE
jgi:hypothetical protein